jgi:hypothetical protein
MTYKQQKLYRAEWAKVLAIFRSQGRATTTDYADAERMAIHHQATGRTCSSKDLTDTELDQVLAAFYVISADLDRYLDAKAQPHTRCQYIVDNLLDRISAHLITIGRPGEAVERGTPRDAYLLYLARRFSGQPLHGGLADIDTITWHKIIACLRIRYDQVTRKSPGTNKAKRRTPYDPPSRRYDQPTTTKRPSHNTRSN